MAEYIPYRKGRYDHRFLSPLRECDAAIASHYHVAWSEPRAFRYRESLIWNEDWAWPRHAGVVAKERIVYKHYPCRSPKQLQVRWNTRKENRERGFEGWKEDAENWRRTIRNSKEFIFDDRISQLKIDESKVAAASGSAICAPGKTDISWLPNLAVGKCRDRLREITATNRFRGLVNTRVLLALHENNNPCGPFHLS